MPSLDTALDEGQADLHRQTGQVPSDNTTSHVAPALHEGQRQRAKPRGLSTTVVDTVSRINGTGAARANTSSAASASGQQQGSDTSSESVNTQTAEGDEQQGESRAMDTDLDEVLPGSPLRGMRGQGKPPLSPVRQSLQDLALSHESSPAKLALVPMSIDPVTGMPKQDVNVHCNPLFTEPMAGQHSSAFQQQPSSIVDHDLDGVSDTLKAVASSPPSALQRSLRARLQQHAEEMEVLMFSPYLCFMVHFMHSCCPGCCTSLCNTVRHTVFATFIEYDAIQTAARGSQFSHFPCRTLQRDDGGISSLGRSLLQRRICVVSWSGAL